MKQFAIGITIMLCVYAAVHFYVYQRLCLALAPSVGAKRMIAIAIVLLALAFVGGMILERSYSSNVSELVYKIGVSWLPFLLYGLLAIVAIDIVRLLNYFFHFLPSISVQTTRIMAFVVFACIFVIVALGHRNAINTRIVQLPLRIHKSVSGEKNVRIALVTDIHFGAIINQAWEEKLVTLLQAQKPDVILFCGDMVDGDIAPVLRHNIGSHLQTLTPPLGLYAVFGNHEYIGGIEHVREYFKKINLPVLTDTVLTLANGMQIVGRNDRSSRMQRPLDSVMLNIDHTKPIVVLNHQPYDLNEAVAQGVDLHLSGHTHHGQLFPFNFITQALFELSWGYLQKGDSHLYVSSGFGTWGPNVRVGNHPEIVLFDIEFDN
ncbi:MAG: metallophosphoesterase [Bacteroidales bacterium]|jgi:predicted MPP superfamily phosphohydrolase|nr:metallophosphoesterase [Bacteroidales bacterium]